jgi:hypothetical protein
MNAADLSNNSISGFAASAVYAGLCRLTVKTCITGLSMPSSPCLVRNTFPLPASENNISMQTITSIIKTKYP